VLREANRMSSYWRDLNPLISIVHIKEATTKILQAKLTASHTTQLHSLLQRLHLHTTLRDTLSLTTTLQITPTPNLALNYLISLYSLIYLHVC